MTSRVTRSAPQKYRINQKHLERVADLLAGAEQWFAEDRRRLSYGGDLWRPDVKAIRYIFDQWAEYRAELLNAQVNLRKTRTP